MICLLISTVTGGHEIYLFLLIIWESDTEEEEQGVVVEVVASVFANVSVTVVGGTVDGSWITDLLFSMMEGEPCPFLSCAENESMVNNDQWLKDWFLLR